MNYKYVVLKKYSDTYNEISSYHLNDTKDMIQKFDYKIWNNARSSFDRKRPKKISRSYYKIKEILEFLWFKQYHIELNTIYCMCEAPGGFVEYLTNHRNFIGPNRIYTSSLKDNIEYHPKLKKHHQVTIEDWSKKNDYLLSDSFDHFLHHPLKHSFTLCTADGGFDCSSDYGAQEEMFYPLFIRELIYGCFLLNVGGTLICKCYDFYQMNTQHCITKLQSLFERVIIYKPNSSRVCSSERYIIGYNALPTILSFDPILFQQNDKLVNPELNHYQQYFEEKQIQFIHDTIQLCHKSFDQN